ncbi:mitochondrial carrier [Thelephora terrestris]|uniref:Mitochondrial carrier n=1 Tax=Thelephora terrestris TaxID=56493 RepID=A0A9P6HRM5_9AGAM|nr:mitochondrial carrier [Thelephora terrestris]
MGYETAKDLTAGTCGGIAQVLVGQPFDIVKVRMQTSPSGTYSGMLDCAGGILKNEGPLAFYKASRSSGTLTPLLGIGLCVSIQFAGLEYSKRVFSSRNVASGTGDGSLTGSQFFASGVIAGLANSVVSGPVEHIRIRLQTQPDKARLYAGPWDAFKKIYRANGIAGIYKGQVATLCREASGYGVYFWTYEKLMEREMTQKGIRRDQVNPAKTALFGAASGYTLWAVIYPIDMIKSRMQTDGFSPATGQKYKSTWDCVRTIWRAEGIKAFTRGLTPTLIRSPFANGATFLGFEMAMRVLNAA